MEEEGTSSGSSLPSIISICCVLLILIGIGVYYYMVMASSPEALTKQFISTYNGKVVTVKHTAGTCLDNQGGAHATSIKAATCNGSKNQQFVIQSSQDGTYFVFVNTNVLDAKTCMDFYSATPDSPLYFSLCTGDKFEYYPGRAAIVTKTRVKNGVTEYMFKTSDKNKNNCIYFTGGNYTQKPCDEKDENQFFSVVPV